MIKIDDFLNGVAEIIKEQTRAKQSGKFFNGFVTARIGTEETRHSAIIAELLDPQGSFGQSEKPLQAFFRQIGESEIAKLCTKETKVYTEFSIIGRRMDIVISNDAICVVIENKTVTVDHDQQLADYRKWLDEQSAKQKRLLYLTYYGSNAVNYVRDDYVPISYQTHICNWLQECAKMTTISQNSFFCSQYQDFIKHTLLRENQEMNEYLQKLLKDKFGVSEEATIDDYSKIKDCKNQLYELINELDNIKNQMTEKNPWEQPTEDLCVWLAEQLRQQFDNDAIPFTKVWIYNRCVTVLDKCMFNGMVMAMDINCRDPFNVQVSFFTRDVNTDENKRTCDQLKKILEEYGFYYESSWRYLKTYKDFFKQNEDIQHFTENIKIFLAALQQHIN